MQNTEPTPPWRLLIFGASLAALSLLDQLLTTVAFETFQHARELNPLAGLAFEQGLLAAFLLKLVAIELLFCFLLILAPTRYARDAERVVLVWCFVYVIVNGWSLVQFWGVI